MRCCQNKTSFSWSYRDSWKRSLENNVISMRGREKYTHFEIGEHVQMAKSDPEAQRKSSLSDCTWLENEYGTFNFETLKFLMHLRESVHFIFTHIHIFLFFFSYIYFFLYFFPFFLFLIFSSFSFLSIFYLLTLNSKIALYQPPPPCLVVCSSSGK
jgi:hypothetical protein